MGHIVGVGKIRVINITPRYATLTYCAKYVSGRDRCKFRHIDNNVQGHSHKSNGRRHDRNYDHYGNNHLTGDQNNYRYGDGPDDPWRYVQLNGRHQNKRVLHNPNIHKNYNINNKHIYSDAYGGYKSHVNSFQGPQMESFK